MFIQLVVKIQLFIFKIHFHVSSVETFDFAKINPSIFSDGPYLIIYHVHILDQQLLVHFLQLLIHCILKSTFRARQEGIRLRFPLLWIFGSVVPIGLRCIFKFILSFQFCLQCFLVLHLQFCGLLIEEFYHALHLHYIPLCGGFTVPGQ